MEKTLNQYNEAEFLRTDVEAVFKRFIDGSLTGEQLLRKLRGFDAQLKKLFGTKGNKAIWFRTFRGDTMATDIQDIQRYLDQPNSSNTKHFIESVTLGVNEIGMAVYFS